MREERLALIHHGQTTDECICNLILYQILPPNTYTIDLHDYNTSPTIATMKHYGTIKKTYSNEQL